MLWKIYEIRKIPLENYSFRLFGSIRKGKKMEEKAFPVCNVHVPVPNPGCSLLQYKVWLKPSSEMTFLYGNHITKGGIARMTDGIPQYAGIVVFSMNNQPLGFGLANQPTERARELDATAVVVLHQADVGEYLRVEEDLS